MGGPRKACLCLACKKQTESGPSATSHFPEASRLTLHSVQLLPDQRRRQQISWWVYCIDLTRTSTANPEEQITCWWTATEDGEVWSRDLWNLSAPQFSYYHACLYTPFSSRTIAGHHHYNKKVSLTRLHSDLELNSSSGSTEWGEEWNGVTFPTSCQYPSKSLSKPTCLKQMRTAS